tara:strand:- start:171 stop:662 length:492 start_codon:yes stop_codon:yes gene_type:complete
MRYFFLFLLLLPCVSGLAVTPTSLDYGSLSRGEEVVREILVVNTLDETVAFEVRGFFETSFSLDAREQIVLSLPLYVSDLKDGEYTDTLEIAEVYDTNLVHAVAIPVHYHVSGGAFSNVSLDFSQVDVAKKRNVSLAVVFAGSFLSVCAYGLYRRKKDKGKSF